MTQARRHHYVPRFYLKRFSFDDTGRSIGVFHIPSGKFIRRSSLKDQACKTFFYGEDGRIEKAFANMEGIAAGIIGDIIRTNALPTPKSKKHLQLLIFVMLFRNRTLYAADAMSEMFEKCKQYDSRIADPFMKGVIQQTELRDPITWTLTMAQNSLPLVSDLRSKLIVNSTNTSFLSSDNPVAFYNQFLEARNAFGSTVGYYCKGLQVLLPISPMHVLFYYDSGVYKLAGQGDSALFVNSAEDVRALNTVQAAHAYTNVYFDKSVDQKSIHEVFKAARDVRPGTRAEVCEVHSATGDATVNYIRDIRSNLSLSFVSIRRNARRYPIGDKLKRHVRDETVVELDMEFRELVRRGLWSPDQFALFLMSKPGKYGDQARAIIGCLREMAK